MATYPSKKITISFPGALRQNDGTGNYIYCVGIPSAITRFLRVHENNKRSFQFKIVTVNRSYATSKAKAIYCALVNMYNALLSSGDPSNWMEMLPLESDSTERIIEEANRIITQYDAEGLSAMQKDYTGMLSKINGELHVKVSDYYDSRNKRKELPLEHTNESTGDKPVQQVAPSQDKLQFKNFLKWRDVKTPCEACGGRGLLLYSDTSTWRYGIGQQIPTADVCDACWGTGDSEVVGANLLELENVLVEQRSTIASLENMVKELGIKT